MDLSFMYKAYCDEAKAVFLCLMQEKKSQIRLNLRLLAEMVGYEPTCPIKDKTISSFSCFTVLGGRQIFIFFQPVLAVRQQEVNHFVLAIIEA